jgi:hypothetical protein
MKKMSENSLGDVQLVKLLLEIVDSTFKLSIKCYEQFENSNLNKKGYQKCMSFKNHKYEIKVMFAMPIN